MARLPPLDESTIHARARALNTLSAAQHHLKHLAQFRETCEDVQRVLCWLPPVERVRLEMAFLDLKRFFSSLEALDASLDYALSGVAMNDPQKSQWDHLLEDPLE